MALHGGQLLRDLVVGCNPISYSILLMAMVQEPELRLLDELDSHQDNASRQLLTQVLADYPDTLLLLSHDPEFVTGMGIGIGREYTLGRETGESII